MEPQLISSEHAPAAIGPYSQATRVGELVFCSGQIPLDPETMQVVEGGIEAQARQVLRNLEQVLAAAGCGFKDVAKTTIFLADMADFKVVNSIYGEVFGDYRPARATVAVAGLPMGVLVEIDCVAHCG
jgi:2-iminobutanoate/2-iminopropanoate deaminase